jgi:hypothetical protein
MGQKEYNFKCTTLNFAAPDAMPQSWQVSCAHQRT